ncbi:TlpA family protein disulfide reductase [Candidatus Woesearchaeota archaeon]|nr:TlpA family protein disulfide reductase [Candidatus Woesearchaeota archaeon]
MKPYYLLGLLLTLIFLNACTGKVANTVPQDVTIGGEEHTPLIPDNAAGNNVGHKAPDLSVTTVDGKSIVLSELTKQKKPVLLYFWATWCPFCKRDLAVLDKVYPNYKDKVKIIAIDLDLNEDDSTIKDYIKENGHANNGVDFARGKESILRDYNILYTTTKYGNIIIALRVL